MQAAVIQLDTIPGEVNYNVHKAMTWTRRAFEQGARFVMLHEGVTADYSPDPLPSSRALDSSEVHGFTVLARQYDGFVALGLNELFEGKAHLSTVFLGADGVEAVYRKSFLWPHMVIEGYTDWQDGYRHEGMKLSPGKGTEVLQVGPWRIGALICADGMKEEAWTTFAEDKPNFICYQNNRTSLRYGDVDYTGRPRALNVPLLVANRVGFSHCNWTPGDSMIIGRDGTVLAQANAEGREEIIHAELDV